MDAELIISNYHFHVDLYLLRVNECAGVFERESVLPV